MKPVIKNLGDYQLAATRTFPDLGSDKLNLAHMVMGMCSEISELADAWDKEDDINISEELTDIMWYLANYCTLRGYKLEELNTISDNVELKESVWYICELTDYTKKYIAYNKSIDKVVEEEHLKYLLKSLIMEYTWLFIPYNVKPTPETRDKNLIKCLQNNIDKLYVRYPDKFNEDSAINRQLDLERKELEK